MVAGPARDLIHCGWVKGETRRGRKSGGVGALATSREVRGGRVVDGQLARGVAQGHVVQCGEHQVRSRLLDGSLHQEVNKRVVMQCTFTESGIERMTDRISRCQEVGVQAPDPVSQFVSRHRFAGRNGVMAAKKPRSAIVDTGTPTIRTIHPRRTRRASTRVPMSSTRLKAPRSHAGATRGA